MVLTGAERSSGGFEIHERRETGAERKVSRTGRATRPGVTTVEGELPKDGRTERGCECRSGRRGDGDGGGKLVFENGGKAVGRGGEAGGHRPREKGEGRRRRRPRKKKGRRRRRWAGLLKKKKKERRGRQHWTGPDKEEEDKKEKK